MHAGFVCRLYAGVLLTTRSSGRCSSCISGWTKPVHLRILSPPLSEIWFQDEVRDPLENTRHIDIEERLEVRRDDERESAEPLIVTSLYYRLSHEDFGLFATRLVKSYERIQAWTLTLTALSISLSIILGFPAFFFSLDRFAYRCAIPIMTILLQPKGPFYQYRDGFRQLAADRVYRLAEANHPLEKVVIIPRAVLNETLTSRPRAPGPISARWGF